MDDLALARALATGDEAAFHTLVDREGAPTSWLRHCILGRVDEAEDAAQETFVLAYRALATYRGDGPPGAWLARIATRERRRRASRLTRRRLATTPLDEIVELTLADARDIAGGRDRRPGSRAGPRARGIAAGALPRGHRAALLRRPVARSYCRRDRTPGGDHQDPASSGGAWSVSGRRCGGAGMTSHEPRPRPLSRPTRRVRAMWDTPFTPDPAIRT